MILKITLPLFFFFYCVFPKINLNYYKTLPDKGFFSAFRTKESDIDAKDKKGSTVLILASNLEIIQYLISQGADYSYKR